MLLTAHSVFNHSVRVAYLDEIASDDSLPTLTSEVVPIAPFSPWFLVGLVPVLVVLLPRRRTKQETTILLSISVIILLGYTIWMARLYIGIDLVYWKFQSV